MEIGGFFPYQPVGSEPNNYVEHTCPDPGDTAHLMSGRCAIYYCLRDLMLKSVWHICLPMTAKQFWAAL